MRCRDTFIWERTCHFYTPLTLNYCNHPVCIVTELGSRYKAVDGERLELKRQVSDAQSSRVQLGELLDKHKELENAHVVQSKFIQKMQKKVGKLDKYVETIETQEKVILRMQSIIECSATNKAKQSAEAVKIDAKFDLSTATAVGISTERVSEDDLKLEECRSIIAEKVATIASITQRVAEVQFSNTSLQEQNAQLQRESENNSGKDAEIRRLTEVVNSYEDRSSPPAIPENSQKRDESSLQLEVNLRTIFPFSPQTFDCFYVQLFTIFLYTTVSNLRLMGLHINIIDLIDHLVLCISVIVSYST
jgi:hypothetical protein